MGTRCRGRLRILGPGDSADFYGSCQRETFAIISYFQSVLLQPFPNPGQAEDANAHHMSPLRGTGHPAKK
jgi:hypothetical protein